MVIKLISIPISTKRLILRRLQPDDMKAYIKFIRNKEMTKYLDYTPEQKTGIGARKMFEHVIQSYDTPGHLDAYAIADKETNQYIGSIGFTRYDIHSVELYYTVIMEQGGNGYAVEATAALIDALPKSLEIKIFCHPENKAAHAVAKKCGLQAYGLTFNKNTGTNMELFTKPAN